MSDAGAKSGINREDGTVHLEDPRMDLRSLMPVSELRDSQLFSQCGSDTPNPPWERFYFNSVVIGGETFAGALFFCADLLHMIIISSTRDEFRKTWGETEQMEVALKKFHDTWLSQNSFGSAPPDKTMRYAFSLPAVASERDIKSGASQIVIRYA